MRRALVAAALAAFALAAAPAAPAHVGLEPTTAVAGSETTFTVTVPHGCAGSPTTEIAIKLPPSVRAAWPAPAPGWDLEATPAGGASGDEGGETAQRLDIVRWSGGRIPDGELGEFRIKLALPDDPGGIVAIPAVQTCEDGETRWIQVPGEGERADDLSEPAPTIALAAAGDGEVAAGTGGDRADLALGLAAAAVLLGAVALLMAIRSRTAR